MKTIVTYLSVFLFISIIYLKVEGKSNSLDSLLSYVNNWDTQRAKDPKKFKQFQSMVRDYITCLKSKDKAAQTSGHILLCETIFNKELTRLNFNFVQLADTGISQFVTNQVFKDIALDYSELSFRMRDEQDFNSPDLCRQISIMTAQKLSCSTDTSKVVKEATDALVARLKKENIPTLDEQIHSVSDLINERLGLLQCSHANGKESKHSHLLKADLVQNTLEHRIKFEDGLGKYLNLHETTDEIVTDFSLETKAIKSKFKSNSTYETIEVDLQDRRMEYIRQARELLENIQGKNSEQTLNHLITNFPREVGHAVMENPAILPKICQHTTQAGLTDSAAKEVFSGMSESVPVTLVPNNIDLPELPGITMTEVSIKRDKEYEEFTCESVTKVYKEGKRFADEIQLNNQKLRFENDIKRQPRIWPIFPAANAEYYRSVQQNVFAERLSCSNEDKKYLNAYKIDRYDSISNLLKSIRDDEDLRRIFNNIVANQDEMESAQLMSAMANLAKLSRNPASVTDTDGQKRDLVDLDLVLDRIKKTYKDLDLTKRENQEKFYKEFVQTFACQKDLGICFAY